MELKAPRRAIYFPRSTGRVQILSKIQRALKAKKIFLFSQLLARVQLSN